MLIGIDASRANMAQKTGVEWYGYHVICELAKIDQRNRYRLYAWEPLRDELANLPDNFEGIEVPNKRFWPYTALSRELKKSPVERLYIPSHLVPRVHPSETTVTIHDIGFRHFRKNYSWYQYQSLNYGTHLSAKWAKHIVVPSRTVGQDITQTYDVAGKLSVIPNGYDREMFEGITPERVAEVMQHHRVDDPYLLFIGRLEVRKNVTRIIEAFYRLADSGLFGGQLVLLGNPGVGYEEIRNLIGKQRRPDQVVQPGYVPTEERAALLRGARALVFPSLYEGFGIPILEAFAAGTPVLTSNSGAPVEVAGDAASLVDPVSVEGIHKGMEQLLADESLASELSKKGTERVKGFGWDKTAAQLHQVLTQ